MAYHKSGKNVANDVLIKPSETLLKWLQQFMCQQGIKRKKFQWLET